MRMPALAAFAAALALSACAADTTATYVEQGYSPGALGLGAIGRGDWKKAETLLAERSNAAADDPARLINLGTVYMETGRPGEALAAWQAALASDKHFLAETRDGRVVSTEAIAREALARYEARLQTASR